MNVNPFDFKTYNFIVSICLLMFLSSSVISQHNYPIPPSDDNLLFYIQRNHNSNTIIFDANFDKDGNLISSNPMNVYWIRYDEQGQKMELRYVERQFAYGVTCNKINSSTNKFEVKIAAKSKKYFRLIQTALFKAEIHTKINGRISILNNIYVQSDNTSFWPRVKYYEQFGKLIDLDESIYDKVYIN